MVGWNASNSKYKIALCLMKGGAIEFNDMNFIKQNISFQLCIVTHYYCGLHQHKFTAWVPAYVASENIKLMTKNACSTHLMHLNKYIHVF